MPAAFPRWANSALRRLLLIALLVVIATPVALMAWVRTPWVTGQFRPMDQPVAFDHRHHVVDDGIGCRYCHRTADRSAQAGIPSSDVCMGCHSQIWSDSPLLEPVRRSYFEGLPLRWNRVHRLPDFVFFDHAAHVNNGVGCETCHGRVDAMARVHQVAPLTMGWCLDCHRDVAAHLRPPEAITAMGWTAAGTGPDPARLAALYDVRRRTDCTTCHR